MKIEELVDLAKQLQDRAEDQNAVRATMLEISAALADLLQMVERSGLDTAKALAAGLNEVRMGDIHMPPAVVHVPAPIVNVNRAAGGWEFKHYYLPDGRCDRTVATPLKQT